MLIARKVNPFWITVIQAYEDLSDRVDFNSASELLIEPLFLCIKFKITFYKVFHFKEWTSKNLFVAVVKHLLEEDGKCFNGHYFKAYCLHFFLSSLVYFGTIYSTRSMLVP